MGTINTVQRLSEFLVSEFPRYQLEFWLFIDEAQIVYDLEPLWRALVVHRPKKFFVVAAGSYGSHTGSAASSPPRKIVQLATRMNLFPSKHDSSCIAFTEEDFDSFVKLAQTSNPCQGWNSRIQQRIMAYASPYPALDTEPKLLHPGVAVGLAVFIMEQVCCLSVYK
jgi:hypothetical protein